MWEYRYSNELYHWGIKGMKWGIRRYQNKDGSLTNLGKKRYYQEADEKGYDQEGGTGGRYKTVGKGAKQKYERLNADPNRYLKEDREHMRTLTNETANLTRTLKTAVDSSSKNTPKVKMDLSNMTDQEMRNQINRAILERQYNDMFAPQNSTKGREYVSKILDTAGSALAITSSALSVALAINQLRGKA